MARKRIEPGVIYYALEEPEEELAKATELLKELRESYCNTGSVKTADVLKVVSADVCIQAAREVLGNIRIEMLSMEGWQ